MKRTRPRNYRARNVFYLRISRTTILMTTLLIDHKHLNWMTETTFNQVLNLLKPKIFKKLKDEINQSNQKSTTRLELIRGHGFQMGYYFKKNTPRHSILLKNKELIYHQKLKDQEPMDNLEEGSGLTKSKVDDEVQIVKPEPDDDLDYIPPSIQEDPTIIDDDNDEEQETDKKPELRVSYTGFSIFGRTLVIVVEPYPALSAQELSLYQNRGHQPDRETSILTTNPEKTRPPLFRSESITPLEDHQDTSMMSLTQSHLTHQGDQSIDDDEDLPELTPLISGSIEGSSSLLSDLIQNPNSDRQNESKKTNRNLTLDSYLVSKDST